MRLLEGLPREQAEAVLGRVVEEREYSDLAREAGVLGDGGAQAGEPGAG